MKKVGGKGFDPKTLKVNLTLTVQRLKNCQNKKANQQKIARKEIARLLTAGKEDSAYVKVEVIIREDKTMEAMELTELFCSLLIARFGLIQSMKYCDDSIYEAVCSVLWVSPRFVTEAKELAGVREGFVAKYGPEFCMNAFENKDGCCNEKLIKRLDVRPPSRKLVMAYLSEIAMTAGVDWTPPPDPLEEVPVPKAAPPVYEPAEKPPAIPDTSTMPSDSVPSSGFDDDFPDIPGFDLPGVDDFPMPGAGFPDEKPKNNSNKIVKPPPLDDQQPKGSPPDDSDDDEFGGLTDRFNSQKDLGSAAAPKSTTSPPPPPPADTDSDDDDFGDLASRFKNLKG